LNAAGPRAVFVGNNLADVGNRLDDFGFNPKNQWFDWLGNIGGRARGGWRSLR
jgi:hypothetical protein